MFIFRSEANVTNSLRKILERQWQGFLLTLLWTSSVLFFVSEIAFASQSSVGTGNNACSVAMSTPSSSKQIPFQFPLFSYEFLFNRVMGLQGYQLDSSIREKIKLGFNNLGRPLEDLRKLSLRLSESSANIRLHIQPNPEGLPQIFISVEASLVEESISRNEEDRYENKETPVGQVRFITQLAPNQNGNLVRVRDQNWVQISNLAESEKQLEVPSAQWFNLGEKALPDFSDMYTLIMGDFDDLSELLDFDISASATQKFLRASFNIKPVTAYLSEKGTNLKAVTFVTTPFIPHPQRITIKRLEFPKGSRGTLKVVFSVQYEVYAVDYSNSSTLNGDHIGWVTSSVTLRVNKEGRLQREGSQRGHLDGVETLDELKPKFASGQ